MGKALHPVSFPSSTIYFLQVKLPHVPVTMHITKVQMVILSPDYQVACVFSASLSYIKKSFS